MVELSLFLSLLAVTLPISLSGIFIAKIYRKNADLDPKITHKLRKQQEDYILAFWDHNLLKEKVENKFNKKGFIICTKNKDNVYDKMLIGKPINFLMFVDLFKKKKIIRDKESFSWETIHFVFKK